ncbi:MAG TPA: DUF3824 domain-containing protein [Candidatus Binatia bacterium]|nr:DUF3824 domain-containing protein [Candidatus Binatia bacterium]
MYRPPVPGSVTLGRVLLILESALWLLLGVLACIGGAVVLAGASNINLNQIPGLANANLTLSALGGIMLGAGIVLLLLSILGIWSGAAMGRLTGGPRVTGIVLASLGVLVGISDTAGALAQNRPTSTLITGIVILVVNVLIIWAIGFSGSARRAFHAVPGQTGMPYPAPAGGYGPTPGYPMPPYGYPTQPSGPAGQQPYGYPQPSGPGGQQPYPYPPPPYAFPPGGQPQGPPPGPGQPPYPPQPPPAP